MTVKEIRERLKHIAGLCYGLSADLQYLEEENARLKADNAGLQALLDGCKIKLAEMRSRAKRKAQKKQDKRVKYNDEERI